MKISIICPIWNSDSVMLRAAVSSVLQAHGNGVHELILVDDASTSTTLGTELDAIERDHRVRLIRNARNLGQSGSRAVGVDAASGEWIGFLDHDDLWGEDRFAHASQVLADHPNAQWIGGDYSNLWPDNTTDRATSIMETGIGVPVSGAVWRFGGRQFTRQMIGNAWLHLGAMLVRKSLLQQAGGFHSNLRYLEDYFLFSKLSNLADFFHVDASFYFWRRHAGSQMGTSNRLSAQYLEAYRAMQDEPLLRDFRKEIRWALYNAQKGLALNNLLSGYRLRALRLALEAFATDPREIRDLLRFLALMRLRDIEETAEQGIAYSRAERFILRRTP